MITCSELSLAFGNHIILDKASCQLPAEGVCALMGASGIGKSSLLKMLAGLVQPDSGTIHGIENSKAGILFQEDRLLPWYNVQKNVMLAMTSPSESLAKTLLNTMEIEDVNAFPSTLSGGMSRRVALARAMAYRPDVLLLDEPFSGIDEQMKQRIAPYIMKSAPLIVFTTHDVQEVSLMKAHCLLKIENHKIIKHE